MNTGKFFYVGKRYRARKTFQAGSSFHEGELLVFERDMLSWHDDAQCYEFRSLSDASSKTWMLGDDEPLSLREDLFERVTEDE